MQAPEINPIRSALYYPFPFVLNDNWLKAAALFWDHIYRIVPDRFSEMYVGGYRHVSPDSFLVTQPSNTAQALVEELDFIKDYTISESNRHETGSSAGRLLDLMYEFPEYFNEHMTLGMKYFSWGYLDGMKGVYYDDYLIENGALLYDSDTNLYYFEKFVGSVYMALLAKYISKNHNIPVVTDDFDHHVLLNCDLLAKKQPRFQLAEDESQGLILCNLALDAIGIKDLSNVSEKKIIKLRQKYNDERIEFVNEIHGLVENLPKEQIKNETQLNLYLREETQKLKTKLQNFENAIRSQGVETVFDVAKVSLSLPLAEFAAKHLTISEPLVIAISGGIGIGALLYKTHLKSESFRSNQPGIYYLHQISKYLSRDEYFSSVKGKIAKMFIRGAKK